MKYIILFTLIFLFGCAEKHKPDVYVKMHSAGSYCIGPDTFTNVAVEKSLVDNKEVSIKARPLNAMIGSSSERKIAIPSKWRKENVFEGNLRLHDPTASFTISRVDPRPFYSFYNGKMYLEDSTGRHELCKCVSKTEFSCQDQSSDTLVIDTTRSTPSYYSHILDSLISLSDSGLILPKIDSAKPLPYYSLDTCKGGIGFSIPPCLVGEHAPNCSHRRYVDMEQRKAVFERQWYIDHPDTSARMQDNFPLHF